MKQDHPLPGYHDEMSVSLHDNGLVEITDEDGTHVSLDAKQSLALLAWLYEWCDDLDALDRAEVQDEYHL